METVGVGQSEVEIAGLADTTVVLLAPGMGDGIQAAKAGILEIGDVYVVNKADRDGADQVRARPALDAVAGRAARGGVAPAGAADVGTVGRGHRGGRGGARRAPRRSPAPAVSSPVAGPAGRATRSRPSPWLRCARRWGDLHGRADLDELAVAVAAGDLDPYGAADRLLEGIGG